ncbi:hypothetical protein [Proteiniclasticum sp. QWL-01]|uniref:phage tail tube protein n=1 Tax=Proteiniclasticum sp. QWL-01 TaxID=3036945 RepID=UPI00240F5AB3|nr:hypothetical protein [Proteiniclasticum sp. QWL-01]WFF72673.1 hypothetical protein P6M73_15595 [Proteiniclasticum sp. QWL-01]
MAFVGVFPVNASTFKVGKAGLTSVAPTDFAGIAELEEIGLDIDSSDETWNSMDAEGWQSALVTGKELKLGGKAKRSIGDPGNDYLAGLAFSIGSDCYTKFEWTFPDGAKVTGTVAVGVKSMGGGKATDVAPLEFEMLSHGKPTFTPAPVA